jgi:predicted porin
MGIGGTVDLDDTAWGISGAYTFGGNVKVGATYMDQEYENSGTTSLSRKTWTIGVDWRIQGPHSVQAQYANADDCKGMGPNIGGNGGCTADLGVGGTGGDAISLAYSYAFSKRTRIKLGYVRVTNDDNTRSFRVGNSAALTRNGEKVDGYAFHIQHNF